MFASNQELIVSGEMDDISAALRFALTMSGDIRRLTLSEIKRGCKLLFQTTDNGKYCIGWGFKTIPNGWSEYPFDFDIDIVSKIIKQYLEKQEPINSTDEEVLCGDGGTKKGFIMKCHYTDWEKERDIKEVFYCIVYFEAFENYYAK